MPSKTALYAGLAAGGLALAFACSDNERDFGNGSAEAGAAGESTSGSAGSSGSSSGNAGRGGVAPGGSAGLSGAGDGGTGGDPDPQPCDAELKCDSPPGEKCEDDARVSYADMGTCEAGECSYAETSTPCAEATPKCQDDGATTQCVECLTDSDCDGATPVCATATNTCEPRPSCDGVDALCGPNGSGDCCASSVVTGGTFYRGYDGATHDDQSFPAKLSSFRLDNYEITVGRFRKFVAAYSQNMIAPGAGANPNNPADTGWDMAWNTKLPATAAGLTTAVKCDATYQTWTDNAGANESRPMNCINWYEAQAFCTWDGGRLPTEAEWNYAAAGGTEQRIYPWGATAPGANANLAVWGCYFNATSTCAKLDIAPVGSVSAGNGRYGQSDLVGNLAELLQDWDGMYPSDCTDCARLTPGEFRVVRGGDFQADNSSYVQSATRFDYIESDGRYYGYGARCARAE